MPYKPTSKCELCGREGVAGFDFFHRQGPVAPRILCSNWKACAKRRGVVLKDPDRKTITRG